MVFQKQIESFMLSFSCRANRISQLRDMQQFMKKTDTAYVMSNLFAGQDGIYFTVSGKQMFDLVEEELGQLEKDLERDREKFSKILAIMNDGPSA